MSDSGSGRNNPKKSSASANGVSGSNRKPLVSVDDELRRLLAPENDNGSRSSYEERELLPKQTRVERNSHWMEVCMQMHSVRKEDIQVEVHDHLLIVSSAPNCAGKDGGLADDFEEAFMLPNDAIRTAILVSFENGALTIFVPRARELYESGRSGDDKQVT
jgi:HSP20 family molecular chaperone IbpA